MLSTHAKDLQIINGKIFLQETKLELFNQQYMEFCNSWQHLPKDPYTIQRYRRYSRLIWHPQTDNFTVATNNYFLQSEHYNSLYGGINRKFAAIDKTILHSKLLKFLIKYNFQRLAIDQLYYEKHWKIGIHQIAVLANHAPGMPTPEGIHQDGHKYLAMHLIKKHNIAGGISTLYNLDRQVIGTTTLITPWDSILLDDTHYLHAVSPVFAKSKYKPAYRYMLLIDYE